MIRKKKRKLKGYWTEKEYKGIFFGDSNSDIPIGTKIPESCHIVYTVKGTTYDEINNKLWNWNGSSGNYYIYIERGANMITKDKEEEEKCCPIRGGGCGECVKKQCMFWITDDGKEECAIVKLAKGWCM